MINNYLKMHVCITVNDNKEQMTIGNNIHEQLAGNSDYVDNNIILNIDSPNQVNLYVYNTCKNEIPSIVI